MTYMT